MEFHTVRPDSPRVNKGGEMKVTTKKAFWIAVLVDATLLIVVVFLGWVVSRMLNPVASAIAIEPTPTMRIYQPLDIIIQGPDNVIPNTDYTLEFLLHNPDIEPVTVKQIILPFDLLDNSSIVRSDPPLGEQFAVDTGAGYLVDLRIEPSETRNISITFRAKKMQAIYGRVILYTDHAKQEHELMVVIAPVPDTPTPEPGIPLEEGTPTDGTPAP